MTIGERIRLIRKEKRMTQKQVAEKCGMADSAIRKYESGSVTPKFDTLDRIASALGVPVTALMGYTYRGKDSSGNDIYAPPDDTIVITDHKTDKPAISDEDIKFAFFGGADEITDEMLDEVKRFAEFVRQREEAKKKPPQD